MEMRLKVLTVRGESQAEHVLVRIAIPSSGQLSLSTMVGRSLGRVYSKCMWAFNFKMKVM